jgi:hypothetical protein
VAPLHAAVGVQAHDRRVLAAVAVRRARDHDIAAAGTTLVSPTDCMPVGLQRDGATFVAATQVEADGPSGLPSAREAVSSAPALKRWTMMLAPVAQPGVGQHLSNFLIIQPRPCEILIPDRPPGRKMNECQAHRRACTELRERLQDGRAPSAATSAFMHEKFRKRHIANRAGPALCGSPRGAPSAARRGMAQAFHPGGKRSAQRRHGA